jgi:hypothetical protein
MDSIIGRFAKTIGKNVAERNFPKLLQPKNCF